VDGVSVENSDVLARIDHLRTVPAAVRFLSCEPLIGSLVDINLTGIHWVIVGGESGPKARSMQSKWCMRFSVAAGKLRSPFSSNSGGGVRKDLTGRTLEGKVYDEMPARIAA
jgi:protein gp37